MGNLEYMSNTKEGPSQYIFTSTYFSDVAMFLFFFYLVASFSLVHCWDRILAQVLDQDCHFVFDFEFDFDFDIDVETSIQALLPYVPLPPV